MRANVNLVECIGIFDGEKVRIDSDYALYIQEIKEVSCTGMNNDTYHISDYNFESSDGPRQFVAI